MPDAEPTPGELDEFAAELAAETDEKFEENKQKQHELLEVTAEEDGAPLLETKSEIYGVVVPVSGRLTGEFIERVEGLDSEAKRRDEGEGVSDIVRELASILDDLIDDPELTAGGLYAQYQREGVAPIRTIIEEVMDSLMQEQERVEGTAQGFRSKPDGS